jgi:glycosyltransferase involved in cell wall biosynthesis
VPTVSVIMNSWNSERYLREAIDSVLAQTYRDFEIIFWDNHSVDRSVEIARGYGNNVKVFADYKARPLGESRNLAIEKASGKYIAFLDCDDVWLPTKLEKQVALLESDCILSLVFSDCYYIDRGGIITGRSFELSGVPRRGYIFHDLFKDNFIPMVTAIARKGALPPFNPKYYIAEEYDVWLKMAYKYIVGFVDEPLAKYRVYPEQNMNKMKNRLLREKVGIMMYWLGQKKSLAPMVVKNIAQLYMTQAIQYLRRVYAK